MLYEVHVTVEQGKDKPKIFGAKTINLELSSGKNRLQTLVGAKKEWIRYQDALAWAKSLEEDLQSRGFKIVRTKLETPVSTEKSVYKEAHWKFEVLDFREAFKALEHAKKYGFLVSWSSDRNNVFWLTKRFYGDAKYGPQFFKNLDSNMYTELGIFGKGSVHFEDVLLDTNLDLDEGWMEFV